MNFENLNDNDLRARLEQTGQSVGPITNTTRGVYISLLKKLTQDSIKMNKPIPAIPPPTPKSLKRTVRESSPVCEETFTVPEKKKKGVLGGIPQLQVPSLRRSTIEKSALSQKLAAEATTDTTTTTATITSKLQLTRTTKPAVTTRSGSARKIGMRNTATTTGLSKLTKTAGLGNTNKLNLNNTVAAASSLTTPSYMRGTNSTLRKGTSTRGRIAKGGRRSFHRTATGRPTGRTPGVTPSVRSEKKENEIPKQVARGSAINKAKDAVVGKPVGKKKRAAWDVKGRLEDVTSLYNELKEEKRVVDERLTEVEDSLEQKKISMDLMEIENAQLKDQLHTTRSNLDTTSFSLKETELKLSDALMDKEEKVSLYNRIKRERDDLEEDYLKTKSKLRESDIRVDDLERDLRRAKNSKEEVEENLEKSTKCGLELENNISALKQQISRLEDTISNKEGVIEELGKTITKERGEKGDVHNILRRKEQTIEELNDKIKSLQQTIRDVEEALSNRNITLEGMENSLSKERREHKDVNRILRDREDSIRSLETRLADCSEKVLAGELLRRKLHNTIQELKGNIRVYCRVRPFLRSEVLKDHPVHDIPQIEFSKDNSALTVSCQQADKLGRKGDMNNLEFTFDHVFGPTHGQEETFQEVAGLVQSALDGFNVCIFAYGQTGSGKTHTMQGPEDPTSEHRGVIPRAMEQVFQTGEQMAAQGWTYTFTASFLEIYNETLHDLISNTNEKIEIKLVNEKRREVLVTNVKNVVVRNTYDVHQLLCKANKNRSVAATNCNERSSRSHSVFRLKIDGTCEKNGEVCTGNLNLVDLAGSERVAHSGSTGQRLKEAQAINTSLSELGNVMMALQEKKSHIPYRNSKLTYLLCNSLGGNSKTLMFVNVSPLDKHTPESINSLRFASKVNKVDLGTAKKNK